MQKLTISIFSNVAVVLAVLMALLFTLQTAHAVSDAYIKLDDIKGESSAQAEADARVEARAEASSDEEAVFCTADAYQCPNGEWVGRTGPNCEFVCSNDSAEREEIEVIEYRNGDDASSKKKKGDVETEWKVEEGESAANAGIEPDEIDVSITEETAASVDVFIKLPPIEGDSGERVVKLEGLQVGHLDEDSDDDGLADAVESGMSQEERATVRVNGVIVRGWNSEIKAAVRSRLAEANERNSANDFGLFVATQAIDHEEIQDIEVDEARASITFETKLQILGFIPVKATAKTTAQANGEVETLYPWWSFLAKKSDTEKASIFATIAANLAARLAT